jgi:putative ABC transport system substrate-binding protein
VAADVDVVVHSANGDLSTLNLTARTVLADGYAVVVTFGTPAMQAVAAVNGRIRVPHVFAYVTDPESAGVGITSGARPDHMTGVVALEPTAETFRLARRMYPRLSRVGVAWNPSEANAEVQLGEARDVTKALGIELLEASVAGSADVSEAVRSLVGRGVEAIWLLGDATVHAAAGAVVAAEARRARIPVFSNVLRGRGVLFAYGLSAYDATRSAGAIAGRIVRGERPVNIPIVRMTTYRLFVDTSAFQGLRDPWVLPADVLAMADRVWD